MIEQTTRPAPRRALYLLAPLALIIFSAEAVIMFVMQNVDIQSALLGGIVDSTLLTLTLFLALYFFVFKKLVQQNEMLKIAEENLQKERSKLEERVEKRTKEIAEVNRNLEKSLARFTDIAEVAGDWFWEMDANLRMSFLSDRFFEVCHISLADVLGKTRDEFAGVSDFDENWQLHLETLANHQPFRDFQYEATLPDGSIRYILISGKPVFDEVGCFEGYRGTGTDNTAEICVRNALEESEKEFRDLVEGSIQGLLIHHGWKIQFTNQAFADMLGYASPEELLDLERVEPLLAPEEHERIWGYNTARQNSEYAPEIYECRCVKKDGSPIWLEFRTTHVGWRGTDSMQCVVIDITEQRRAKEKLQEQNERFNTALDNMSQGLCMFDNEQRIIVCNERYASLYGLTSEQVKPGTTLQQIVNYRIANGFYTDESPKDYIREELSWINGGTRETKFQELSDGRSIAITHQLMLGGGWVTTHEDVTEITQAQQVVQRQKEELEQILRNVPR